MAELSIIKLAGRAGSTGDEVGLNGRDRSPKCLCWRPSDGLGGRERESISRFGFADHIHLKAGGRCKFRLMSCRLKQTIPGTQNKAD